MNIQELKQRQEKIAFLKIIEASICIIICIIFSTITLIKSRLGFAFYFIILAVLEIFLEKKLIKKYLIQ